MPVANNQLFCPTEASLGGMWGVKGMTVSCGGIMDAANRTVLIFALNRHDEVLGDGHVLAC